MSRDPNANNSLGYLELRRNHTQHARENLTEPATPPKTVMLPVLGDYLAHGWAKADEIEVPKSACPARHRVPLAYLTGGDGYGLIEETLNAYHVGVFVRTT